MSTDLGAIRQLGYVVHDIEAALSYWTTTMKVGPFFHNRNVVMHNCLYRGNPSPVVVSIALAQAGPVQIELIQPLNDAGSPYREFLDSGFEGLEHVAYWPDDYAAAVSKLQADGREELLSGYTANPDGPFTYFGPEGPARQIIEVSCLSPSKRERFDNIARASIGWDGTDPVRIVG